MLLVSRRVDRRWKAMTDSCDTACSSQKEVITKSSLREMAAARSQVHPSSSSTFKSETFNATGSRRQSVSCGFRLTARRNKPPRLHGCAFARGKKFGYQRVGCFFQDKSPRAQHRGCGHKDEYEDHDWLWSNLQSEPDDV